MHCSSMFGIGRGRASGAELMMKGREGEVKSERTKHDLVCRTWYSGTSYPPEPPRGRMVIFVL